MQPIALLPYLLPIILVGVMFLRARPGRARRVRRASLWVVPMIASFAIGSALWFQPHPALDASSFAILAVAFGLGVGTGTLRARAVRLRRCPDTDQILMETSNYAFLLLVVLFLLRTGFRNVSGGWGVVAVDASMLFALGMIVMQRFMIWMRVRRLPRAA